MSRELLRCFQLYHELARTFPAFLQHAGKDKRERWTTAIDVLAADFSRLLDDRLVKGGGELSSKINAILEGDWKLGEGEHDVPSKRSETRGF